MHNPSSRLSNGHESTRQKEIRYQKKPIFSITVSSKYRNKFILMGNLNITFLNISQNSKKSRRGGGEKNNRSGRDLQTVVWSIFFLDRY